MIVAPHRHRPGSELADLTDFLALCRDKARASGAPLLASVTLPVRHIDPLAVLLKTRRPDELSWYRECPAEDVSVAALDTAVSAMFSGRDRFLEADAWCARLFAATVAAGDPSRAFGGPVAFLAAPFGDDASLTIFIPRRMVARRAGEHTAVANTLVTSDSDPAAEAARMLGAHARFASFDYGAETVSSDAARPASPAPDFQAGEPAYADRVRRTLARITEGPCLKLVPARCEAVVSADGFDTAGTLETLRARHPGSHTFSFSLGDGVEWLGATPETLIRVEGDTLRTEALAGTGPRARHAGDDARLEAALLSDEKILREQRAVTDALARRLRAAGLSPEFSEAPRILRLAHARHLLTPVTAKLPGGFGALRVADRLHPTPAVAGTPRDASLAALRELEDFDRGHYAGATGWVDARGDAHLTVNLRCGAVSGDTAKLFAGAGVVSGSSPEGEAKETTLKLRTIAEALF